MQYETIFQCPKGWSYNAGSIIQCGYLKGGGQCMKIRFRPSENKCNHNVIMQPEVCGYSLLWDEGRHGGWGAMP